MSPEKARRRFDFETAARVKCNKTVKSRNKRPVHTYFMENSLNAVAFYKKFLLSFKEDRSFIDGSGRARTYMDIYRCDEKQFTYIANKILIEEIIESFGLTVQHEYFRIDTVGYLGRYLELDKAEAKKLGMKRHLWDLKIVVEHENNKADWLDELIKLIHIKCPLKVVIGYNYCDRRENGESGKLRYAAECMNKIEAFNAFDPEEYLLIIGSGEPKERGKPMYQSFDYRGYLYNPDSGFEAL